MYLMRSIMSLEAQIVCRGRYVMVQLLLLLTWLVEELILSLMMRHVAAGGLKIIGTERHESQSY